MSVKRPSSQHPISHSTKRRKCFRLRKHTLNSLSVDIMVRIIESLNMSLVQISRFREISKKWCIAAEIAIARVLNYTKWSLYEFSANCTFRRRFFVIMLGDLISSEISSCYTLMYSGIGGINAHMAYLGLMGIDLYTFGVDENFVISTKNMNVYGTLGIGKPIRRGTSGLRTGVAYTSYKCDPYLNSFGSINESSTLVV